MHDSKGLKILESLQQLINDPFHVRLGQLKLPLFKVCEQIAPFTVLHHKGRALGRLADVVESHDVWVLANFEDFDFSSDLSNLNLFEIFMFDLFNCHLSPR